VRSAGRLHGCCRVARPFRRRFCSVCVCVCVCKLGLSAPLSPAATATPPQEEEIRRAAEERQKREDAEAAKWMGQISVEETGVDAEDGGEGGETAAARFIAYIQERKMVSIEEVRGAGWGWGRGSAGGCFMQDWALSSSLYVTLKVTPSCPSPPAPRPPHQLATEFRLRSSEVVEKLTTLESQGQLTGVMDERGKFIHISSEEMKAVADFMRGRGRVAIAELAARSGEWPCVSCFGRGLCCCWLHC